ncbi:winged helix domain-containing protein [Paracoccus aestuarii]|uniref:winged helix domain-containing protein n=1 Tax=Paracoccus aestuarii TaxID=453842 RepID=UPI001981DA80|nr:hypothetical protein [Paracoccus aestuarii]WCQ98933.1 hypothetical protein JHW48_13920 [Paracoccus aestuarii]
MAVTNKCPARVFTIKNGNADPLHIIAKGRDRWAHEALMAAGSKGCNPISNPAPRWAAYVHNLRAFGVMIDTTTERHGGSFAGHHARYVLRCIAMAGQDGFEPCCGTSVMKGGAA